MVILQVTGAMSFSGPTEMEQLTLARQLVLDDPCEAARLRMSTDFQTVKDYVSAHVEHAGWHSLRFFKHIFNLRPDRSAPEQDRVCVVCHGQGWAPNIKTFRLTRYGLPLDGAECCQDCKGKGQAHDFPWIGVNQGFYSVQYKRVPGIDIRICRAQWRLLWHPRVTAMLRWNPTRNNYKPGRSQIDQACHGQSLKILHRFDVETRGQLCCDLSHGSQVCQRLAERIKAAPVWSKEAPDAERNRLWTGHLAKAPHPNCWCAMCTRARYRGEEIHEGYCDYCPVALADASQR